MLLIDFSPTLVSVLFAIIDKRTKQFNPLEYRNAIINSLISTNRMFREEYGTPIICYDDPTKKYWRKNIFPNYKGSRIKNDSIDWKLVFNVIDDIKDGIDRAFTWKSIEVAHAEADDIISVLVDTTDKPIIIISPDRDFIQLQKNKNVKHFDKIHNKNVISECPEFWLKEKIIRGDRKDTISNIFSDINHLYDMSKLKEQGLPTKKQKSVSKKNLNEWIKNKPEYCFSGDVLKRYKENEILLDLSCIPQKIKNDILKEYAKDHTPTITLLDYFVEIKESFFIQRINDFK